jgi:diguanylate cyclase (GGDEF)-like protein
MDSYIRCLIEADNDQTMAQCAADAAVAQLTADCVDVILPNSDNALFIAAISGWPAGCAEALLASRKAMTAGQSRELDCQAYDGCETSVPWPIVPPAPVERERRNWPALLAPVCWPRSPYGSLTAQRRETPFTPDEKLKLVQIGQQLTLALSKMRDLNLARQHVAETNLMYRLSALAAQQLSGPELLAEISRILVEFFRLRHAALALLDADGQTATVVSNYSSVRDGFDPIGYKIPLTPGSPTAIVLETRRPLQITDVPNSPLLEPIRDLVEQRGTQTILVFPLLMWGEAIGTFGLDIGEKGRVFSPDELHLLQAVMGQISSLVENVRLLENLEQRAREAEQLATHDSLTGLYNRRFFFEKAKEEFARAKRHGRDLALIMMDVDDFKQVNDRYGHLIGDCVLQEAAARMSVITRETDLLARYGGDEFILLLPETDYAGALVAAERLRRTISAQPAATERGPIAMRLSLGVAFLADHPDLSHLLDQADRNMYQEKLANEERLTTNDERRTRND